MRWALLIVVVGILPIGEYCLRDDGVAFREWRGGVGDAAGFVGEDVGLAILYEEVGVSGGKAVSEEWGLRKLLGLGGRQGIRKREGLWQGERSRLRRQPHVKGIWEGH